MIATLNLHPAAPVLGINSLSQDSPARVETLKYIASASHEDTCIILDSSDGIFRLTLICGEDTPEHANNPDGGAINVLLDDITYDELDAFDQPIILRKGDNWILAVKACSVFTDFTFTPQGHEPTTLSVSLDILCTLAADAE